MLLTVLAEVSIESDQRVRRVGRKRGIGLVGSVPGEAVLDGGGLDGASLADLAQRLEVDVRQAERGHLGRAQGLHRSPSRESVLYVWVERVQD